MQWGPRLRLAMNKYLTYVDEIEREGEVGKSCAKTMVNHLVGSWAKITHCTSTVKSTTASDPSYLNALLFTAGQVGSANVSISRHRGTEYQFNPEGTLYDYYKLRTVSTAPKSSTFHVLHNSVTLRTESEVIRMMLRLPGPKCPLLGVSKWLIAVHVDCVEYYRDIHTLSDYAYCGDHMAKRAQGVPGPVEYDKWAIEADGLRVEKTTGNYHAAYYSSLSMRRQQVVSRTERYTECVHPTAEPQLFNRVEVPFMVGDMVTTKALRTELFDAKGRELVYKHYQRFKKQETHPMSGLALLGPPGVGKTYGLVGIHKTCVDASLDVVVLVPTGAAAEALK